MGFSKTHYYYAHLLPTTSGFTIFLLSASLCLQLLLGVSALLYTIKPHQSEIGRKLIMAQPKGTTFEVPIVFTHALKMLGNIWIPRNTFSNSHTQRTGNLTRAESVLQGLRAEIRNTTGPKSGAPDRCPICLPIIQY